MQKKNITNTLSLFVFDSIIVSESWVRVEIATIRIYDNGYIYFGQKEIAKLREVLRASIKNYADCLSDDDIEEFGNSMLQATAVILKAKYSSRKSQLESK
jgi:hypothetical protein